MSSPLTKSLFALSTDVDQKATRGEDPLAKHSNLLSVPFNTWTVPLVISERLTVICATGGSTPGENIPLCEHMLEAATWHSYKMATVSSSMILLQLGSGGGTYLQAGAVCVHGMQKAYIRIIVIATQESDGRSI